MYKILQGDVMERLAELPDASFHGCLTDPPYGLKFMGEAWDHGVPSTEVWAEVLRVLKPGAMLLAFGGTRTHHRLMCNIEDAGFEIRDCMMYLYGAGFPKSLDISKAIDKAAGAENVIGRIPDRWTGKGNSLNFAIDRPQSECKVTAPATPAAKTWSGYGTALKPSLEPVILAHKSLTVVPFNTKIMAESENLIGGLLCQLFSNANSAEAISKSNHPTRKHAESASALMIAAIRHGSQSAEWCEKMATFNSPEMVKTCLSIVWSWSDILDVTLKHENIFTTSTAIELTTALKTLNYCLSETIPDSIIEAVSHPVGSASSATDAASNSTDAKENRSDTRSAFARVLASLRRMSRCADGADVNIMLAARSASFVLHDAITNLVANLPDDLFPRYEPICLAMKPTDGTFANNALTHGVAGINVDGGRIGTTTRTNASAPRHKRNTSVSGFVTGTQTEIHNYGRWPANLILDEEAAEMLDRQSGTLISGANPAVRHPDKTRSVYGAFKGHECKAVRGADSGGASRFFYCAKASASERTLADGTQIDHPTMKPLALTTYLARLILPPCGGSIFVPYSGVASEVIGAIRAGWTEVTGIDLSPDYCEMAERRIRDQAPLFHNYFQGGNDDRSHGRDAT